MIDPDKIVSELRRQTSDGKMSEWCRRTGISRAFAYRVLNGVDPPSDKVCKALGFTKSVITTYEVAK